jgi:hypothetical protein
LRLSLGVLREDRIDTFVQNCGNQIARLRCAAAQKATVKGVFFLLSAPVFMRNGCRNYRFWSLSDDKADRIWEMLLCVHSVRYFIFYELKHTIVQF